MKTDGCRCRAKKKELILHIMYDFCVIYNGNISHSMMLLRKLLRQVLHYWDRAFRETAKFWFVRFPKHLLLTISARLVLD